MLLYKAMCPTATYFRGLSPQLEMWGCSSKLVCGVSSHIWFALKMRHLGILKAQLNASTHKKLIWGCLGFFGRLEDGVGWPFIKTWSNLKYRTSQNHKLWFRPTWLFWIITSSAHWVSQELVFSSSCVNTRCFSRLNIIKFKSHVYLSCIKSY